MFYSRGSRKVRIFKGGSHIDYSAWEFILNDTIDIDGDGIFDYEDSDLTDGPLGDSDGDGILNKDEDLDGDGIPDGSDNDNTDGPLGDSDGDGILNKDEDLDGDGIPDGSDNDNTDGPLGDSDGDGILNKDEDLDGDGIPDGSDNDNTDGPLGDSDGDGILNKDEDLDGDGIPDGSDNDNTDGPLGDSDGDGVLNKDDGFPSDPNRASGIDTDGDGIDDEFDSDNTDGPLGDSDGDGVVNPNDPYPDAPNVFIVNYPQDGDITASTDLAGFSWSNPKDVYVNNLVKSGYDIVDGQYIRTLDRNWQYNHDNNGIYLKTYFNTASEAEAAGSNVANWTLAQSEAVNFLDNFLDSPTLGQKYSSIYLDNASGSPSGNSLTLGAQMRWGQGGYNFGLNYDQNPYNSTTLLQSNTGNLYRDYYSNGVLISPPKPDPLVQAGFAAGVQFTCYDLSNQAYPVFTLYFRVNFI